MSTYRSLLFFHHLNFKNVKKQIMILFLAIFATGFVWASPPITGLAKIKFADVKKADIKAAADIKSNCCPEVQYIQPTIACDINVSKAGYNTEQYVDKKSEAVPGEGAISQEVEYVPSTIAVNATENDIQKSAITDKNEVAFNKLE